jgi:tetratricopeptide (TPR) repeat protein
MASNYEIEIEQAEQLRQIDDCDKALEHYMTAVKIGGELDVHCRQMIGVCLNRLDRPKEALEWLDKALDNAASDTDKGNIWRDKSQSYRKLKKYSEAEEAIKRSFEYVSLYANPSSAAASLSFYAQIMMEQGDLKSALERFKIADAVLQAAGDKAAELYNALKYAYALAQSNQPDEARLMAKRALELAGEHGGKPHEKRAQLIIDHAEEPEVLKEKSFKA